MDARSSDAWMARAILAEAQDPLTLAGSREAFSRAVSLDPRNEEAWHQYGSLLAYLGQDSAAFAAWRRTLELDPGRPQTLAEVARLHYYRRGFAEATTICRDPTIVGYTSGECALALALSGDTAAALAAVDSMDRIHGHLHPNVRARITGRHLDTSDPWVRQAAREPGRTCSQLANNQGPAWLVAGQPDSALALLEGCAPRGPKVWFFLRDPVWDPVRDTPRFQRLWNETRPP
jgi:tetratricopeptide (TPR) repeat protein